MTKRQEKGAGARFDRVMALFRNAWAEEYPSQPFEVNGVVTPEAMRFIAGYEAGLRARKKGLAMDRVTADDPVFLDIVRRIVEALTPLGPAINDEVLAAIDELAVAVMETLPT